MLELKQEGRIGGVSFGIYPMDLWKRIFTSLDVDAGLVHNHYCLNDTRIDRTVCQLPRLRELESLTVLLLAVRC